MENQASPVRVLEPGLRPAISRPQPQTDLPRGPGYCFFRAYPVHLPWRDRGMDHVAGCATDEVADRPGGRAGIGSLGKRAGCLVTTRRRYRALRRRWRSRRLSPRRDVQARLPRRLQRSLLDLVGGPTDLMSPDVVICGLDRRGARRVESRCWPGMSPIWSGRSAVSSHHCMRRFGSSPSHAATPSSRRSARPGDRRAAQSSFC